MYILNTIVHTKAAEHPFSEAECPLCHRKGHVCMEFFNTKTINVAWGISFPTKATAKLSCGTCRNEIPTKQWTSDQKEIADTMGRQYRNKFRFWPRWFVYVFILLVGGAIVYEKFFYVNKFTEAAKSAQVALAAPRPGMVLAFHLMKITGNSAGIGDGKYALIEAVDGENLQVRLSKKSESDPFFYTVLDRKFSRADFADEITPARFDKYGNLILPNPTTGRNDASKVENVWTNAVH